MIQKEQKVSITLVNSARKKDEKYADNFMCNVCQASKIRLNHRDYLFSENRTLKCEYVIDTHMTLVSFFAY
jgi:hypothetical protein